MSRTITHNPATCRFEYSENGDTSYVVPIARWITAFGCWNTPKPSPRRTVVPLPPIWYMPL